MRNRLEKDADLMARAAWLSFVGDMPQARIAERLGVSRVKVNRLIAKAVAARLVRFSVDAAPRECVLLEDDLMRAFGLESCFVAPAGKNEDWSLDSLAAIGARALERELDKIGKGIAAVGHGRTLQAAVEALAPKPRKGLRFVSLLGCLSRVGAADPFDVIHHLGKTTAAESYYLPAPLFTSAVKDRQTIMRQKLVRKIIEMGQAADLCVIGVGGLGPESHLYRAGMITESEGLALLRAGAVGDILGCFIDIEGRRVECDLNRRAVTAGLETLRAKRTIAIAGGRDKTTAIAAALRSGAISALATDEQTAAALLREAGDIRLARRA